MAILFRHGSSVRLSSVIIGKLRGEEIREQRSERKGFRRDERNYFGCGGSTLRIDRSGAGAALSAYRVINRVGERLLSKRSR
jgi:hypothetical protein